MSVSSELKKEAVRLGLCAEWTKDWGEVDLDNLCEMFISGIDFCIQHNYPSNEYIKKNFGKVAENHGIYVDSNLNIENPDVAILLGDTKGDITFSGYVSRDVYARHNCTVNIIVKENAKVFIRVYDNANISIDNQGGSVFIYKYIDMFRGKVFINGDATISEKIFKEL